MDMKKVRKMIRAAAIEECIEVLDWLDWPPGQWETFKLQLANAMRGLKNKE